MQQPRQPMPVLPVTYTLIALNVIMFILQYITGQNDPTTYDPLTQFGALDAARVINYREYYRLFTAMFLHADEAHIFFNMLSLFYIGRFVEPFFGVKRFLLIYFIGGLAASVASVLFTRGFSVGASGAIFAIFAAEIVGLQRNRLIFGPQVDSVLRQLLLIMGLNLLIGITSQRFDNWAHAGGFLTGAALTWQIGPHVTFASSTGLRRGRYADSVTSQHIWIVSIAYVVAIMIVLLLGAR